MFDFYNYRYTVNPKMDIQKRENLTIALEFLSSVEKFPLVNIGKLFSYVYVVGTLYGKLCHHNRLVVIFFFH